MSMRSRTVPNETPATLTEDLSGTDADGSQMIGFTYWVATAGGVTAGAFNLDIQWEDPSGQTRTLNGSPISLQDPNASFASPAVCMRRSTANTLFDLVKTLIGAADGAEIGYSIIATSGSSSDIYGM